MIWLDSLSALLRRELGTLRREVEAYPDEAQLWSLVPGLPNSGGILTRHLAGNLQHYFGAVLGGSPYRRDRDAEFLAPPSPRSWLLTEISASETAVRSTLAMLTPEMVAADYPQLIGGQRLVTGDFLVHLAVHCGFHLGQVDYHRRVVTGSATSAGPMSIPAMASARAETSPSS